jgi:hypothetical protein
MFINFTFLTSYKYNSQLMSETVKLLGQHMDKLIG